MVRSKNPFRWIQKILGGADKWYYLCLTPDRIHTARDIVTGKITITKRPGSCRKDREEWHCGEGGRRWEPSKEFLMKKENLFKQIVAGD
jgi:hypothetical protein